MDLFMVSLTASEVTDVIQGADVWELVELLQDNPSRLLNLEEAWCGLHFVLTGEVPILKYEAIQRGTPWYEDSLENILMGGEPTAYKCAFGMVRCVPPGMVAYMAPRLVGVGVSDLRLWYNPEILIENSIPPEIWSEDASALQWLLNNFVEMKKFYHDTARQNYGLLIYIT